MTYMADGKQYIIVAVSGGNYSGEYIAFALPASETRTTNQAEPSGRIRTLFSEGPASCGPFFLAGTAAIGRRDDSLVE